MVSNATMLARAKHCAAQAKQHAKAGNVEQALVYWRNAKAWRRLVTLDKARRKVRK